MLECLKNLGHHFLSCWLERRCKGNSIRACINICIVKYFIDHTNEFTEAYGFSNLRTYF